MTEKNKFQRGDRVRIVGGMWAGDCGTVVLVAKDAVNVRADTRLLNVIVRPCDLERIE